MPVNKNAFLRYRILDELLSSKYKSYTITELLNAVNDKLTYYLPTGNTIVRRTLEKDIKFLVEDSGLDVELSKEKIDGKQYISYADKNYSIFKYDYIRFYTGKKSTIIVVSKDFDNPPIKRYALMNINGEMLTDFIFRFVDARNYAKLNVIICSLLKDGVYAIFDLSLNNINSFAPFLGYEHYVADSYDEFNRPIQSHNEPTEPFKNVRLYIDTETTGLPKDENASYKISDNWPYLVQIGLIIEDDNYGILSKRSIIVKPNGYDIPKESSRIHGISTDYAIKVGVDRKTVISLLDRCFLYANTIIGHNISFDINIIKAEIYREKGNNSFLLKHNYNVIDTMKIGMSACKMYSYQFGYKYPRLTELYLALFHQPMKNAHNAMADIQATYDCYQKLLNDDYKRDEDI